MVFGVLYKHTREVQTNLLPQRTTTDSYRKGVGMLLYLAPERPDLMTAVAVNVAVNVACGAMTGAANIDWNLAANLFQKRHDVISCCASDPAIYCPA